jgi:hypothetical protein
VTEERKKERKKGISGEGDQAGEAEKRKRAGWRKLAVDLRQGCRGVFAAGV